MLSANDVKADIVFLSMRRPPHKLLRRMAGRTEVPESTCSSGSRPLTADRLEAVLSDAQPVLRRLAQRLCDNGDDVRDLIQDTFERAVSQGIPPEIRSTRGWLRRIMFHLFIDGRRAAARQPGHEMLEDGHGSVTDIEPDAGEPAWTRITLDDVQAVLEEIDEVYRNVYRLRTFEHLSYEQIAERLSIERITVGTRLSRARKRLREVLVRRFGLEDAP